MVSHHQAPVDTFLDASEHGMGVRVDGLFVWWVEIKQCRHLAFPLIVAGLNPITLYVLWQLSAGFIRSNLTRHLHPDLFLLLGPAYEAMLQRGSVLLVIWLILLWMYRQRCFIRI